MITFVEEKYVTTDGNSSKYVEIQCESTDTKPTEGIAPNSLALELDTDTLYYFDGSDLQAKGEGGGGGGGGGTGGGLFTRVDIDFANDDAIWESEIDCYRLSQAKTDEANAILENNGFPTFVTQDSSSSDGFSIATPTSYADPQNHSMIASGWGIESSSGDMFVSSDFRSATSE